MALTGLAIGGLCLFLAVLAVGLWIALQNPALRRQVSQARQSWNAPSLQDLSKELSSKPRYQGPLASAVDLCSADELFRPDRIWNVRFSFTAAQWQGIQAQRVEPLRDWISPKDGTLRLSNPNALRNGLAGVLGFDFPWSTSRVDFGGVVFTNVATRFKGNGTFLDAGRSLRKPFKLDIGKGAPGRNLAGRTTFNLANLVADQSCLSDTLGYEFYREAGVPAPRTSFARLFVDVEGALTNRLLGLYLLVENPDGEWAQQWFGATNVALFKPVTQDLFRDLGPDWSAYRRIYDPRTPLSESQQQRVIQLARLVSHASDKEFAREIGHRVDIDQFCRFLACEVLLSNFDGILATGQNFLMYLDPKTDRFGFIPWDLDHAWGGWFPFGRTPEQRTQVSIWTPWVGCNVFLERMFRVERVRDTYRRELERLLSERFVPETLGRRIDELAQAVRPLVEEWSAERLAHFDLAVSENDPEISRNQSTRGGRRPVRQLKRFIRARAENVRQQLHGAVEGVVIRRKGNSP